MKRTSRKQLTPSAHVQPSIQRALRDTGSCDSQMHSQQAIKYPCDGPEGCGALVNERCASERYPSGRARVYSPGFCDTRLRKAAAAA
jgi:hypothetical protein